MLILVRLGCICKRVLRAKVRKFNELILQQPGTYIQEAYCSSSVEGKVGAY